MQIILVSVEKKRDEEEFKKHESKKLKYYTTNLFADNVKDLPGTNFHDGFGTPSQEINKSTSLRGQVSNPRIKMEWGALPVTAGTLTSSGPTINHILEKDKRSCNPVDGEFYKRSFYFLDINPNAVQKSSGFRGGLDTRNDTRQDYK